MSFVDNIENFENINTLAVIKPRSRLTSYYNPFSTYTGFTASDIYAEPVPASFVTFFVGLIGLTEITFTLRASKLDFTAFNQYYFDRDEQILYFTFDDPTVDHLFLADYELHLASSEMVFFRDPKDADSEEVLYLPYVGGPVSFQRAISEEIIGFMPSYGSSLDLINVDKALLRLFKSSTLSRKPVEAYLISGDTDVDNVYKTFTGIITDAQYTTDTIRLSIADTIFTFEGTYNLYTGENILNSDVSGRIDPRHSLKYVKDVFGTVHNLRCANTDFNIEGGATFNNDYVICKHYAANQSASTITRTVVSNALSATDRTYLNDVTGINAGDNLFNHAILFDFYVWSVNREFNYVTHQGLGAAVAVDTVLSRERVGALYFLRYSDGQMNAVQRYFAGETVFWTTSVDDQDQHLKFNFPIPNLFHADQPAVDGSTSADQTVLVARVYSEPSTSTITGESFNGPSDHGINSKWHHVLYDYFIRQLFLPESAIDIPRFVALEADIDNQEDIGVSFPNDFDIPSHRENILKIISGGLHSVFQKSDGKISVTTIGVMGTPDFVLDETEILSLSYDENFSNTISIMRLLFKFGDFRGGHDFELQIGNLAPVNQEPGFVSDTFQDANFSYIYDSNREKSLESSLFVKSQANSLSEKLFFIYAYPYGEYTVNLPLKYLETDIGQVVELRHRYLAGGVSSQKARVMSIKYNGRSVELKLWTQQGIEDNPGVFT